MRKKLTRLCFYENVYFSSIEISQKVYNFGKQKAWGRMGQILGHFKPLDLDSSMV